MPDTNHNTPNPSKASRRLMLTRAAPMRFDGAPAWWLLELARTTRVAAAHPTMARMREVLLKRSAEYEAAAAE